MVVLFAVATKTVLNIVFVVAGSFTIQTLNVLLVFPFGFAYNVIPLPYKNSDYCFIQKVAFNSTYKFPVNKFIPPFVVGINYGLQLLGN